MDLRSGIVLVGWLVGWWLLWRVPWLGANEHPDEAPGGATGSPADDDPTTDPLAGELAIGCTIIVPARNEASSLPNLLASLERQTVLAGQVIVVDDGSSDETASIARAHRAVTVLAGEPVPDGWTGKTWACHQAATVAAGDTLVFLDADVVLAPDGIATLLAEHRQRGGLVSVQPYHQMRKAYERLSALFNVIGVMGIGSASPGHDASARGAFGPVVVTGRADYDRAGGHAAVRGDIVEDIALARRYVAIAAPVHAFGGGRLARFRMYPDGIGQLIEGWSKNFATGAGSVPLGRLFLIGFWVTCVLVSIQSVIELAIGTSTSGWFPVLAGYVLFAVQLGAMLRQVGNFGVVTAVLYPGPVGLFLVVFARSSYLTLVRRQVTWRGRSVPLSRSRRWSRSGAPTGG